MSNVPGSAESTPRWRARPRGVRCLLPTALPAVRPIGLVGPMSNFVAPPQLVENVPYQDVAEMQRFARQWRDEHRRQWFTVPKLSGFCLLMKRAVYDKIGGLDERFGLGLFDDDDLAERARRAGFELAVAHDLFVHHFGSRTFLGNGIDIDELLEENARRFAAKWGLAGGNNGRERVLIKPWRRPVEAVDNSASAGARGRARLGRARLRPSRAERFIAARREARPPMIVQNALRMEYRRASRVRVAWEGDFEALHSLAIVNRAVCRGLIDRGHDVRLIASSAGTAVEPDEHVELDAQTSPATARGRRHQRGERRVIRVRRPGACAALLAAGDRAAGAREMGAHAAVGIRQLAESVGSHASPGRRGLGL